MTYRGKIQNGVVVLDGNPPLAEGTVVKVEPQTSPEPSHPAPGTVAALLEFREKFAGGPDDDIAAQAAIIQAERDADLTPLGDQDTLDDLE